MSKKQSSKEASLEDYSEYDDPLFRREIRAEYRSLIGATQQNKDELIKPESTGLSNLLEKTDHLFDKVRHTREAVLDSNLLLSVASLGSEQAKQLQTDFVTFDSQIFADKLIQFMVPKTLNALQARGEDDDDDSEVRRRKLDSLQWKRLGKKCCSYFKRTPTLDFMLGPLVIEVRQKQRKPTQRGPKDKLDASQKVAPQELTKVEEQEEATTKEVERIYGILRKATKEGSQPICLFDFIIDPKSFGRTIENIFHLSFLVKDGKASIDLDENQQPVVCKSNPYREQDYREVILHKQIVMPLSMDDWKEIIEVYGIKQAMIPRRPEFKGSR